MLDEVGIGILVYSCKVVVVYSVCISFDIKNFGIICCSSMSFLIDVGVIFIVLKYCDLYFNILVC